MKPGPELDKAVADSCGFLCHYATTLQNTVVRAKLNGSWSQFSPSTNLNHAFLAAEKTELFRKWINPDSAPPEWDIAPGYEEVRFLTQNKTWKICQWLDTATGGDYETVSQAPTPALAICFAILNLAEQQTTTKTPTTNTPFPNQHPK